MVKKHHGTVVKVVAVHSIVLPIDTSVRQEQPNWCWAACLSVIVKFRMAPRTQCQIATLILPKATLEAVDGDCCTFGSSSCFAAPNGGVPRSPCDQSIGAGPFKAWLKTQDVLARIDDDSVDRCEGRGSNDCQIVGRRVPR